MRDLTEREMMQTQGGFAYENVTLRALGVSHKALSKNEDKIMQPPNAPSSSAKNSPESALRSDHSIWRDLADTQRDIRQLERGRPFRQGAFRSRFLNR